MAAGDVATVCASAAQAELMVAGFSPDGTPG